MSENRKTPDRGGVSRRTFVKTAGALAGAAATPFVVTSRKAFAEPVEINMLSWYGLAEPDMVAAFEAEHNVKFRPVVYQFDFSRLV